MNDFSERTQGFNGGKDIITNKQINTKFEVPAMSMQVIELTK
jgi:hypothetical protein